MKSDLDILRNLVESWKVELPDISAKICIMDLEELINNELDFFGDEDME